MVYGTILFLICLIFLFKTNNLIMVMVSSFFLFYTLNTTALELILGVPFSPSQNQFNGTDEISIGMIIFIIILYSYIGKKKILFNNFHRKKGFDYKDLLKSILIVFYAFYLISEKGFRIDGSFVDFAGTRSIIEDYIALIFIVFFLSSRASKPLIISFFLISFAYLIAGERMRMFIYLGTLVFYLYSNKIKFIKFAIPLGYAFAELISIFRSSTSFGLNEKGAFVSHFGSVTISSLYLQEFSNSLGSLDKLKYFIGILLGNLFPSSMLGMDYDIRGSLFNAYQIPGGGWFTTFIIESGGWAVFILISFCIGILFKRFIKLNYLAYQYIIFVILITLPRWLMYSPYLIFRFAIYSLIILSLIKLINGRFTKGIKF